MDYKTALKNVRRYATQMLRQPGSGLRLVAVGSKEAGPLVGVKDFCVTAYVDRKLTRKQLKTQGLESVESTYAQCTGKPPASKSDIDVVESQSAFVTLGLNTASP